MSAGAGVDVATLSLEVNATRATRDTRELTGVMRNLGAEGDRTAAKLRGLRMNGAGARTAISDAIQLSAANKSMAIGLTDVEAGMLRTARAGQQTERALGAVRSATMGAGGAMTLLKASLASLGIALGGSQLIRYADSWKLIHARLSLVAGSTANLAGVEQQLFQVAARSRASYEETATLYTRVARNAAQLGLTQKELIQFTESTSKAIAVGGSSAQEAASGLRQLSQALASGELRADEFRAVMENLPGLAQSIAAGLGVTVGELRKMSTEGELTAKAVTGAVLKMKDQIESDFGKIPLTVGQAFQQLQNSVLKYVGVLDSGAGGTSALAQAIVALGNNIGLVVTAAVGLGAVFAGRWLHAGHAAVMQMVAGMKEKRASLIATQQATLAAAQAEQVAARTSVATHRTDLLLAQNNLRAQQARLTAMRVTGATALQLAAAERRVELAQMRVDITAKSASASQVALAASMRSTTVAANALAAAQSRMRAIGGVLGRLVGGWFGAITLGAWAAFAAFDHFRRKGIEEQEKAAQRLTEKLDKLRGSVTSLTRAQLQAALADVQLRRYRLELQQNPNRPTLNPQTSNLHSAPIHLHEPRINVTSRHKPGSEFAQAMSALDAEEGIYRGQIDSLDSDAGAGARTQAIELLELQRDRQRALNDAFGESELALQKLNIEYDRREQILKNATEFKDDKKELERVNELTNAMARLKVEAAELADQKAFTDSLKDINQSTADMERLTVAYGQNEQAVQSVQRALELERQIREATKGLDASKPDEAKKIREKTAALTAQSEAEQRLERMKQLASARDSVTRMEKENEIQRAYVAGLGDATKSLEDLNRERAVALALMELDARGLDKTTEEYKELARRTREAAIEQYNLNNATNGSGSVDLGPVDEAVRATVENMQRAFAEAFDRIFAGGAHGFRDLASEVLGIFRKLAAEIAATLAFKALGLDKLLLGLKNGIKLKIDLKDGISQEFEKIKDFFHKNLTPTQGRALGVTASAAAGYAIGSATKSPVAGALGGAASGAMIGSVLPGIGTAAGAVIGGLAGVAGGLIGMGKAAAEARERLDVFRDAMHEVGQSIQDLRDNAAGLGSLGQQHRDVLRSHETAFNYLRDSAKQVGVHIKPLNFRDTQATLTQLDKDAETLENRSKSRAYSAAHREELGLLAESYRDLAASVRENLEALKKSFAEDLDVRLLRAQADNAQNKGLDKEADALRKRADLLELERRQAQERADALKLYGADSPVLETLRQVHAQEQLAIETRKATDAINDATSALNSPSGLRISLFRWRATQLSPTDTGVQLPPPRDTPPLGSDQAAAPAPTSPGSTTSTSVTDDIRAVTVTLADETKALLSDGAGALTGAATSLTESATALVLSARELSDTARMLAAQRAIAPAAPATSSTSSVELDPESVRSLSDTVRAASRTFATAKSAVALAGPTSSKSTPQAAVLQLVELSRRDSGARRSDASEGAYLAALKLTASAKSAAQGLTDTARAATFSLASADARRAKDIAGSVRTATVQLADSARLNSLKLAESTRAAMLDFARGGQFLSQAPQAPEPQTQTQATGNGGVRLNVTVQAGAIVLQQKAGEDANEFADRVVANLDERIAARVLAGLEQRERKGGRSRVSLS